MRWQETRLRCDLFLHVQTWRDETLEWNPDDYCGIEEISVASNRVWKPEIILYNRYV